MLWVHRGGTAMKIQLWNETQAGKRSWHYSIDGALGRFDTDGGAYLAMDMVSSLVADSADLDGPSLVWTHTAAGYAATIEGA